MAETLMDMDESEHYIRRGDPTKPTYYIIRRQTDPMSMGLFAAYMLFAGHIRYALSNGWIPVIDMQNYPNAYLAPEKLGKENSWEYYFEQPLRVGLEQAYAGENVILSNGGSKDFFPRPSIDMNFYENKDNILIESRMLVKLGLLRVKPALMAELLPEYEKLFSPNDRVLGVLLRGTDYVTERPDGHPIPPPIEFALGTIIPKINEWKCNKIFLATEDKTIINIFKNVFGDFCVVLNREYVDYRAGEKITLVRINRENDHFLQGKDYLKQIVILSKCNSLIAARCGGSLGAMMFTDKYEHTYFFNLGRYNRIILF